MNPRHRRFPFHSSHYSLIGFQATTLRVGKGRLKMHDWKMTDQFQYYI